YCRFAGRDSGRCLHALAGAAALLRAGERFGHVEAAGRFARGSTGRLMATDCADAGHGSGADALVANHRNWRASSTCAISSHARCTPRGGPAVIFVLHFLLNHEDLFRILPEVILTLTGVLVILLDATLPPGWARRPLGWVAAFGTTLALWGSLFQLSLPEGTGFYGTVETSAFTVFFHVLICGIVLVALLLSLDTLPETSHHQGEFYALIVFGAVGMCLLTGAVELLLVFIALEISSIATYVLAGYRKHTGRSPEAAIKYFLLGSFATAFLLYGIALIFGATGSTQIYEIANRLGPTA